MLQRQCRRPDGTTANTKTGSTQNNSILQNANAHAFSNDAALKARALSVSLAEQTKGGSIPKARRLGHKAKSAKTRPMSRSRIKRRKIKQQVIGRLSAPPHSPYSPHSPRSPTH